MAFRAEHKPDQALRAALMRQHLEQRDRGARCDHIINPNTR